MNKRRGLGIWPLVLVIILLAVLLYDTMLLNRAGDYTYPQFLQDIQNRADAIEEVVIVPNGEVPTGKVEVLWNDDSQSECYVTDVNEVQSLLRETQVDTGLLPMQREIPGLKRMCCHWLSALFF